MFKAKPFTVLTPGPEVAAILIDLFRRLGCTVVEEDKYKYIVSHAAVKDEKGRRCKIWVPRPTYKGYGDQMAQFLTGVDPDFPVCGKTVDPPFFAFLARLKEAVPLPSAQEPSLGGPPVSDPSSQG